jgi:3-oxoacyl-[acyl-carrier protein] reductase
MLRNNVVFVTGSSRGIGKAIAEEFARNGYKVAINCTHSKDELIKTENELKEINPNIYSVVCDVSDYEKAKVAFEEIEKNLGHIDIMINNAGIAYIGLFNTMKPDEWQHIMNVNLNSVFNCTHLALQNMIKRQQGCIINISSMWGNLGASCEAVYSASKGAINAFTKAMAKEVAPSNIRVNAIACGAIDTKMNSLLSDEEKADFAEEIPLMRFGKAEEVAQTALFLVEKASYVTGQIIGVDGGLT